MPVRFIPHHPRQKEEKTVLGTGIPRPQEKSSGPPGNEPVAEISCETCFFGQSGLCSLPKEEACPTFRAGWLVKVPAAKAAERR